MSNSFAVLFALSMAVWVADVRLTPKAEAPREHVACESGLSDTHPADADAEIVVCGSRP
jgi:hypothetical protein